MGCVTMAVLHRSISCYAFAYQIGASSHGHPDSGNAAQSRKKKTMSSIKASMNAAQMWQKASIAYGQMLFSSAQVIQSRSLQMMQGNMRPEEATRMLMEKPAAMAKALELAARAQAAQRGAPSVALAALRPFASATRANARRLSK